MPDNINSRIKCPADLVKQPAPVYSKKEQLKQDVQKDLSGVLADGSKKKQQKQDIQNALSGVLADGVISNDEIARLAKLDFTVEDVQKAFHCSISCVRFSYDDRQKLTDELMTRIETYRQLNQEREGQEPTQFGL